jgi:hypothetical protein
MAELFHIYYWIKILLSRSLTSNLCDEIIANGHLNVDGYCDADRAKLP